MVLLQINTIVVYAVAQMVEQNGCGLDFAGDHWT